ncbi:MAG: NAD(P)H-hydrate epimerase, partial [Alphaproteobacteria bacterium]|nr:NAD(P)H-hydrate epimerase [Alphaproteobacteria bacterium]
MKHEVLSVAAMQKTDLAEIESGTDGLTLMENAGYQVFLHVRKHFPKSRALVLCGPGNNGGDGFVVARLLAQAGWKVAVCLFGDVSKLSNDCLHMFEKWKSYCDEVNLEPLVDSDGLMAWDATVVIDAIFGTGLDRDLPASVLATINNLGDLPVVSVDIPTGIHGDSGRVMGGAFNAHSTVTFCRAKTGQLLQPGRSHCGALNVADIGIRSENVVYDLPSVRINSGVLWEEAFSEPSASDHKFSRGYVMV